MTFPEGFGGGPFEGGPLADIMRNLARLFSSQGSVNWEIARQMAQWAAAGGQTEPNPDPLSRVRLEELLRVAEMHVTEATGLPGMSLLTVTALKPSEWALRTLEDWRPLLEKLAERLNSGLGGAGGVGGGAGGGAGAGNEPGGAGGGAGGADPMANLFAGLPQMLGPFLFGLQAGSMVGQLAARAMGQFDLPMPRPARSEVIVVPATIDGFAEDWSLPADDVRMWVCLREATNLAVLGLPHVRARLEELIGGYVGAFSPSSQQLEERLANLDLGDMAALQDAFGDPSSLIQEMQNDEQRHIQAQLRAVLCAVVGYVDHVMDTVGRRLVGSYGPLTEALRRRRLEEHPGDRILGQLLGVSLEAAHYEQGQAFVAGVIERAGEDGLARLWRSEADLPTPAEIAAPGLWLARIEFSGETGD